jgi:tRNA pseudouridine55 synthase
VAQALTLKFAPDLRFRPDETFDQLDETRRLFADERVRRDIAARPDAGAIRAALPAFRGDILQVPPSVSAVKVDGARAYDLAREGEAFDLAARPLYVDRLDLIAMPDADTAEFEMVCGKGGYVRAIARDLGRELGCLGHVAALRRVWSGPFEAEGALSLDDLDRLAEEGTLDARLLPIETALVSLPEAQLSADGAARVQNGNPGAVIATTAGWGDEVWASHGGRAVGVGTYRSGEFHPTRVFQG